MEKVVYKASPEEAFFMPESKITRVTGPGVKKEKPFSEALIDQEIITGLERWEPDSLNFPGLIASQEGERKPFILANTTEVTLEHLQNECIIPVFSKDNELTIAHQQLINSVMVCITRAFPLEKITTPEIRVSHQIKGRTPDALDLDVRELHDHHKTLYYERMMFIGTIPSIKENISGNELSLTFGAVRSYNLEN